MGFTEVHVCCGVEFALGRSGHWCFLTPLPAALAFKAGSYLALLTPDERVLVRNTYKPDRAAQIAAIETMLRRHFSDATAECHARH